jgi:two-component system, NarL family, invasion response regulator UvrY
VSAFIRILLVDDHAVVREGYRRLLERDPFIEVVAEANNGAEACRLATELAPTIVVMDIALPGGSGIEAMRRMLAQDPKLRVLIFSMHGESIFVSRAVQGGAFGYITKSSAPEILVKAVSAIARGERYFSADVAGQVAGGVNKEPGPLESLTSREFEVLRQLALGESVKAIGEKLGLSEKTVANHQSAIREKLGVKNSAQLARIAAEFGLTT